MLKINGKEVHLKKALPLTIGDWEDLEDIGVTPSTLGKGSYKLLRMFLTHVCNKANNEITANDVRSLTLEQMMELNRTIRELQDGERTDVPFSSPLTDSLASTVGLSETSEN